MKLNIVTIRYWMARNNIDTDAELGRRAGWSKSTTSRILGNVNKGISTVRLKELAATLGRPEAELVELDDVAQTPFEKAALASLKDADPSVRAAIHALLKLPNDVSPNA